MEKNITTQNKRGIVFSDLESTLVGGGEMRTWEEYTEECAKVAPFIDLILSHNNYFVIVSSCYHDAVHRVTRKFNIIYNFLKEENRDKIMFFCSDTKKSCVEKHQDVNVHMINGKQECVDIVLDKLKNEGVEITHIVGFGDDEKDLEVLLKIKELGGTVEIVADPSMRFSTNMSYLDFENATIDEIIEQIVSAEFDIETKRLINKKIEEAKYQKLRMLKHLSTSEEYIELAKRKQQRACELKEGYITGTINNEGLQNCLTAAELTNRYYSRYIRHKEFAGEVVDDNFQKKIYSVAEHITTSAISSKQDLLNADFIRQLLKD